MANEEPPSMRPGASSARSVDSAPGRTEVDPKLRNEAASLIRDAFEAARASGHPEPDVMTSAVLKNRLLDMTGREFDERRYGARSFVQLLRLLREVVAVEGDHAPYHVRLIGSGQAPASAETKRERGSSRKQQPREAEWRHRRIREDLWNAVLDYSTQTPWVLDPDTNRARPQRSEDHPEILQFSTVTATDMERLREEFIQEVAQNEPTLRATLEDWNRSGGSTLRLPRFLQGRWNQRLKETALARLRESFAKAGVEEPPDLLFSPQADPPQGSPSFTDAVQLSQLRDLLTRCVRVMTLEELRAIELSIDVYRRLDS